MDFQIHAKIKWREILFFIDFIFSKYIFLTFIRLSMFLGLLSF